jgi:hypothetical protein
MKRCGMCGGPFGLVRHYHFDKQFCCRECHEGYRRERARQTNRRRDALARMTALVQRAESGRGRIALERLMSHSRA